MNEWKLKDKNGDCAMIYATHTRKSGRVFNHFKFYIN